MSKQKKIKDYRQQFIDQGYTIVENVLTVEEAKKVRPFCLTKFDLSPRSFVPIYGEYAGNLKHLNIVFLKLINFATLPKILH